MLMPARLLKGVGPRRAEALARLGVETVGDLLYYFPRDWQDRFALKDFAKAFPGGQVVARGIVTRAGEIRAGPRMAIFKAELAVPGPAHIEATWFKHLSRRYDVFAPLKKDLVRGAEAYVVGRAEASLVGVRDIQAEEHYAADDPQRLLNVERIAPVYALTEGITQRWLRALMAEALDRAAESAPDVLPEGLALRRGLLRAPQALRGVHFPGSRPELSAARERFAYEELLLLELAWSLKRREARRLAKGFGYEVKRTLLTPFRQGLGFELTAAQKRVINEIFDDMKSPSPMTRLLQGDVGSGKTVVALSALLLAVENGRQGAFMAPSAILAEQHKATLDKFLSGLPVRTGILTSRTTAKQREKILAAAAAGELDILVGTHALLEEDVRFKDLSLAVIDEQHRFGVRQRATLRRKNSFLDLLIMTATPIPRTLALALYGDLEVSVIDEMPPGKAAAKTIIAGEAESFAFLRAEVQKGRQGYVVYPIIEESSRLDLRSAKAQFERLKSEVFPDLSVALIHGALPAAKKAKIMEEFSAGKHQILVATPVIEVGIDVPNATAMIIQNAERFGMASLHQLRGRVGRGSEASCCFLVGAPQTEEARARLAMAASTSDGFRLSEEDLRLRGPGELLGTAQHGDVALKVADLVRDKEVLARARADAEALLAADPKLLAADNKGLRERLIALYQRRWGWIDLA
ncbi:MAG: ATP-dependent DNA helicase RecG [Elusimicrobia bacterium]|nr:ATP-dependent DNA helicase RecG [Elusimicrobiota bacterium]